MTIENFISPLRKVINQLAQQTRALNAADDAIGQRLRQVEELIRKRRPTGGPVDVAFPPWGKLGWSQRPRRFKNAGYWRLVVVDDEECEDLLAMPRECRASACLLLRKLIERLGVL